jgi:hypothetical protein
MKLRTRLTLIAAPVIIAGSLMAAPAGSQPFEGPGEVTACPAHIDCGPDDPGPGFGGDEKIPPPPETDCELVLTFDDVWEYVGEDCDNEEPPPVDPPDEGDPEPDPDPDPDPETPEVPDAEPEAPRPGKPNFTG